MRRRYVTSDTKAGPRSRFPTHDVVRQYVKHQSSVPRIIVGAIDIGGYEY